ncbi:MAG: nucleotidyltransferase family protein [Nitrososphaerota archaeon]|nr:nucleotidyltransferase family protein [Nitrososphaerota archaeon]
MFSGLILAAGLSSRMGRPKQQMLLRGRPMLDYAVDAFLSSRVREVLVVVRQGVQWRCPLGARLVVNPRPSAGISSSLRVGLKSLDPLTEGVLVGLGDKPALQASTIDALILARSKPNASIVVPTFRGSRGNPVLFDRALFPQLQRLRGDQGARAFLQRNASMVLEVAVDDPGVTLDVNVPEDVRRMSRLMARLPSDRV